MAPHSSNKRMATLDQFSLPFFVFFFLFFPPETNLERAYKRHPWLVFVKPHPLMVRWAMFFD